MSKLGMIQASLYELLKKNFNNVTPKLSKDFDLKKNIGIEYKIGRVVTNKVYRKDYTFEVQVTGLWAKLLEIQDIAENIDKLVNKKVIENFRIIEASPQTSFDDGDKHTIVLQYLCTDF